VNSYQLFSYQFFSYQFFIDQLVSYQLSGISYKLSVISYQTTQRSLTQRYTEVNAIKLRINPYM